MSILSKLGKKFGLSGQEKSHGSDEDAKRDVFKLNKEPVPEPIAEANPAVESPSSAEPEPAPAASKSSFAPEPAKAEAVLEPSSEAETFEAPGLAESDSELLSKLYRQGANLSIPRHSMFFLYFPTEQTAKTAQTALGFHPMSQASGFQVTVDLEPSPTGWLCLLQLDLIVNRESISHVRTDLEALAAQLGGVFEGWEASLQAA